MAAIIGRQSNTSARRLSVHLNTMTQAAHPRDISRARRNLPARILQQRKLLCDSRCDGIRSVWCCISHFQFSALSSTITGEICLISVDNSVSFQPWRLRQEGSKTLFPISAMRRARCVDIDMSYLLTGKCCFHRHGGKKKRHELRPCCSRGHFTPAGLTLFMNVESIA